MKKVRGTHWQCPPAGRSGSRGARLFAATIVAASVLAATPARAQGEAAETVEPLSTDRPDITEASVVVGKNVFQIETSVQREYFEGRRAKLRGWFTPTLLRWGVHDRWEMRLETDGYSNVRASAGGRTLNSSVGYGQLSPGVKYHFSTAEEGSRKPSLGLIFHVNVPSGSGAFKTNRFSGDLKLAADFELGPRWGLGVNVGPALVDDGSGTYLAALGTASLGYSITDRLRPFVELAAVGAEERGGDVGTVFDGGMTYLLSLDTQVDFSVGTGISGRLQPDLFWSIGLSHRFR